MQQPKFTLLDRTMAVHKSVWPIILRIEQAHIVQECFCKVGSCAKLAGAIAVLLQAEREQVGLLQHANLS